MQIDLCVLMNFRHRRKRSNREVFGFSFIYPVLGKAKVEINLHWHDRYRRRSHTSIDKMVAEIVETIDHEYVHVFTPAYTRTGPNGCREEWCARAFEIEGHRARR